MTRQQAEGVFWVLAGVAMCILAVGISAALVIWASAPNGFV